MSWLARSLANSLRLDDDDGADGDDDDEDNDVVLLNQSSGDPSPSLANLQRQQEDDGRTEPERNEEEEAQARGVKEDLSEIKHVLTRQFWGVASFLAPPPSEPSTPSRNLPQSPPNWDRSEPLDQPDPAPAMAPRIEEKEEEEEEEELEEYAVGITEEVLAFARNIAMHPETWLDFPLDEEDDLDGKFLSSLSKIYDLGSFYIIWISLKFCSLMLQILLYISGLLFSLVYINFMSYPFDMVIL